MLAILLAEDDALKAEDIIEALTRVPGVGRGNISVVTSVVDAKRALVKQYDLFIVDIVLPIRENGAFNSLGGARLIESMRASRLYRIPTHILGLTAFEDAAEAGGEFFRKATAVILKYDRAEEAWRDALVWRVEQIVEQKNRLGAGAVSPEATGHQAENRTNRRNSKSALALSGGGLRATFFHLGVLGFHFQKGSLRSFDMIAAVSGGAILAAHVVLNWKKLIVDEDGFADQMANLIAFARSNIRNGVLIPWIWSVGTGWRFIGRRDARLAKSRAGRLVSAYRRFFGVHPLKGLDCGSGPRLALVSTDLYHSSRVYFSHDGLRRVSISSGVKEEPFPQKVEVDVAFAVAASSCFPPVFRPLILDHREQKVRWDAFKLRLRLQDGGVHDNLGLRALQNFPTDGEGGFAVIHASYAVNPKNAREPATGWWADRWQAFSIYTQGEQAYIANDLAALAGGEAIITKLEDYVPADEPHLLDTATQTAVMGFRTDLDAPTWQELYCLLAHGFQVAALRGQSLNHDTLESGRALLCRILAGALSRERSTSLESAQAIIREKIWAISARTVEGSRTRPKIRIILHLVLYACILCGIAWIALH